MDRLFYAIEMMPMKYKSIVRKAKGSYIVRMNEQSSYVYILISGVVISSVRESNGSNINFFYNNMPEILTLPVNDCYGEIGNQLYDIKADSDMVQLYKIDRIEFWGMVKNDPLLNEYIDRYYRKKIEYNRKVLSQSIGNNKSGQIYAFLYRCSKIFGVKDDITGNTLIRHKIKHKTIGEFCGIKSRSSVTRVMSKLERDNVIEQKSGYILIKDMEFLKRYKIL